MRNGNAAATATAPRTTNTTNRGLTAWQLWGMMSLFDAEGRTAMKRTQVQLDEQTYEALRRRAFEKKCSVSALVRQLLADALGTGRPGRRLPLKDFSFIGAGRSRRDRFSPVSERHDEALAEVLEKEHTR